MNARWQFLVFNVGLPLLFVGVAGGLLPIGDVFQFSSDEGLELAKADLYMRGYQLYTEIWNDQPPLPTVLWSWWLSIFGHTILSARLLTLSFGTVLVWAFTHSVRLTSGVRPALLAGIGLIFSNHFVELSSAVMMGVPSLSMAVVSMYALLQAQATQLGRWRWAWLLISALYFAISAQLKAFTLFLVPVLLLYLAMSPHWSVRRIPWRQLCVWLGGFAIATLFFMLLLPHPNPEQTLGNHFNSSLRAAAGWTYGIGRLLEFFIKDPDYWLLAFFALLPVFKKRSSSHSPPLPLLWLIATFVVLLWHRPIHYHYYLLLSLPLTWLAALGASEAIDLVKHRLQEWPTQKFRRITLSTIASVCLGLAVLGIPVKAMIIRGHGQFSLGRSSQYFEVLPQLTAQRQQTHWLFTDVLMYSFYAQLPVPPETAVLSSKRITAGNLTVDQLRALLEQYQPEQVVLGRFPEIEAGLQEDLEASYQLIHDNSKVRYFQRNPTQPLK